MRSSVFLTEILIFFSTMRELSQAGIEIDIVIIQPEAIKMKGYPTHSSLVHKHVAMPKYPMIFSFF